MRAIILDVDGVIVDGYHANPKMLQHRWDESLQADLGIDPDRFRTEFIYDVFVKQVIVGRKALVDALDRALPAMGYHGSPMDVVEYWLTRDSTLNEPLLEVVRHIKERTGTPLFLGTNQEHLRAYWLWQSIGLNQIFDDIFYSARLGAAKPDPTYFARIDRLIGQQDDPPLFFDDSPNNITAARAHGWEAALFNELEDFTGHPLVAPLLDANAAL